MDARRMSWSCLPLAQCQWQAPVSLFYTAATFNADIGRWWSVAATSTMASLLSGASSFNQNIGGWNAASVVSMAPPVHASPDRT